MSSGLAYFITLVIVYILVVWGALIPFRAGLLYNGTVYVMAIGGYTAGFLSKTFGLNFWLCIIAAIITGLIFGFIPALGFARTNGIVTAISSMALIFIIQSIIKNIDFLGGTRGLRGIAKVPALPWFAIIILIIFGAFLYRLFNSRIGRAWEAIATDPQMAQTLGVDTRKMTVIALTLSSVFAAVGGAVFAFNIRVIYPGTFSFTFLLNVMTMLFVGGRFTQWGVIISAPLLWSINVYMPEAVQKLSNYIFAGLLIIVLMLRPEGLVTRKMILSVKNFFKGLFKKKARETV
ncbi:MAG: branched-chain amino acid ABC transporter permease [Parasporobacterium sp.]|nr:branched-chain amino acid ABC transporter permease [Parasporobacterium sp.]MBQ9032986.1 branched-chain amino acid ABC transporter permease [Parasporobacterium sp.]